MAEKRVLESEAQIINVDAWRQAVSIGIDLLEEVRVSTEKNRLKILDPVTTNQ